MTSLCVAIWEAKPGCASFRLPDPPLPCFWLRGTGICGSAARHGFAAGARLLADAGRFLAYGARRGWCAARAAALRAWRLARFGRWMERRWCSPAARVSLGGSWLHVAVRRVAGGGRDWAPRALRLRVAGGWCGWEERDRPGCTSLCAVSPVVGGTGLHVALFCVDRGSGLRFAPPCTMSEVGDPQYGSKGCHHGCARAVPASWHRTCRP